MSAEVGTTATDFSGEGNDGTIDGATWNYVFQCYDKNLFTYFHFSFTIN